MTSRELQLKLTGAESRYNKIYSRLLSNGMKNVGLKLLKGQTYHFVCFQKS